MLCYRRDMKIALCRGRSICDCCHSWRNDNRGPRMSFCNRIVYRLAIIRTVRCHRSNTDIDLIEQVRYLRDITHIIGCQVDCDDFMRAGIHAEVKLAPPPARSDTVLLIEPFAFAINFDAGAVDQEMQ